MENFFYALPERRDSSKITLQSKESLTSRFLKIHLALQIE